MSRRTKKQAQAIKDFEAAFEECKASMHPQDVIFEPKNFKDWVSSCDHASYETLQDFYNQTNKVVVNSFAVNPCSNHVKLRTPFRDYAEATICRRFPEHADQFLDDIPF